MKRYEEQAKADSKINQEQKENTTKADMEWLRAEREEYLKQQEANMKIIIELLQSSWEKDKKLDKLQEQIDDLKSEKSKSRCFPS